MQQLAGTRAQLVPLTQEHRAGIYEAAQHPDIWTYLPKPIITEEDAEFFIQEALHAQASGLERPYAVIDVETEQIVGSTRLMNISAVHRHLEIGWTWYHPSVWRTRINTECKYLLLRHSFEELATVRVQFCADIRNVRSNAAIARLGAIKEGILRKNRILSTGYIRDASIYSIIEEEWPAVKEHLLRLLQLESI